MSKMSEQAVNKTGDENEVEFVKIGKMDLLELLRRAQGTQNVHLFLHQKDIELKKCKKKNEALKARLIQSMKFQLEKMNIRTDLSDLYSLSFGQDSVTAVPSANHDSSEHKSLPSLRPSLYRSESLETDGAPILSKIEMSSLPILAHPDNMDKPCKQVEHTETTQLISDHKHISSSGDKLQSAHEKVPHSNDEGRRYHSVPDFPKATVAMVTEQFNSFPVTSGVSKQYFDNVVLELKKTKQYLHELLKEKGTDVKELVEPIRLQEQNQLLEAETAKLRSENQQLKFFLVHVSCMKQESLSSPFPVFEESEPISLHTAQPAGDILSGDSSHTTVQVNSGELSTQSASQDAKIETGHDPTELQKKMSLQEQELQALSLTLEESRQNTQALQEDKDRLFRHCEELGHSIEELQRTHSPHRVQQEKQQLEEENFKLKNQLEDLFETNQTILHVNESLQEHIRMAESKNVKMEALLEEEKSRHQQTKVSLLKLNADLKQQLDKLSLDYTRLKKQIRDKQTAIVTPQPRSVSPEISLPVIPNKHEEEAPVVRPKVKDSSEDMMHAAEEHHPESNHVCERCFEEFAEEERFLKHLQKCLD